MKFKVTLEDIVEYEVEAESKDEAIASVVYRPMYDTARSIEKVNESSTVNCEEMS